MDTVFASALRRLPRELAKALEQAGLDDASTLANYTRLSLVELQSRGFCVEPVEGTTDTVVGAAAVYDVSSGGGTAAMCILSFSSYRFPLLLLSVFPPFPTLTSRLVSVSNLVRL